MKAAKEHRVLEMMKSNFDRLGTKTTKITLLRRTLISTIEPENVKCVLSTDFRSYCLSDGRKELLGPVLGEGIFTTDGKEWVLFLFVFFESSLFEVTKDLQNSVMS